MIKFPSQARYYLGLKEIDSGWDIVYQYYGYNDSYREGDIIRKIIHESISGHYDIHDEIQYHEIDAYIETQPLISSRPQLPLNNNLKAR